MVEGASPKPWLRAHSKDAQVLIVKTIRMVQVPAPSLGHDMAQLLESGQAADVRFKVEEEELAAHKFILTARSPVFRSEPCCAARSSHAVLRVRKYVRILSSPLCFCLVQQQSHVHLIAVAHKFMDCRALLNAPMREGQEGDVDIQDVRKPVFQALLYFTYTDQLPEVTSHVQVTVTVTH